MNKHILSAVMAAGSALLIFGCGDQASPGKKAANTELRNVYKEYREAIQNEDLEKLKELIDQEKQNEISSGNAKHKLKLIRQFSPKEIQIIKKTVNQDKAVLEVASAAGEQKMTGKVMFVLEDGKWKVSKEDWIMKIDLTDRGSTPATIAAEAFFPDPAKPPQAHLTLQGHQGEVSCLEFSPDDKTLASASYGDYSVRIWDPVSGEILAAGKSKNRIRSLQILKKDSSILTADAYKEITSWPVKDGKVGTPRNLFSNAGDTIAVTGNGKTVATTAFKTPISIWELSPVKKETDLSGSESARVLCFSPDGMELVSGSEDNSYTIWDADKWKGKKYRISKVQGGISSIDISRDGKKMATGHNDSSIVIFDFPNHKELHNFFVRDAATRCVRISPDGRILATANNEFIYLWDIATGKKLARLAGHKGAVLSLAFSNDGRTLASGSEDRTIILWRCGPPPKITAHAKPFPAKTEEETVKPVSGRNIEISGFRNLVRNPSADQGDKFWRKQGDVAVETRPDGNPCFTIRYKGTFQQDARLRDAANKYLLLIARATGDRIHKDGDQTGCPYLYGYWGNSKDMDKFNGYIHGQQLLFRPREKGEWGIAWGIFKIPPQTGFARLLLQQADGRKPQDGSAARFDDVGIYLFDQEADAKDFIRKYREKAAKL